MIRLDGVVRAPDGTTVPVTAEAGTYDEAYAALRAQAGDDDRLLFVHRTND